MGLIKLAKAFAQAKRGYDVEVQRSTKQEKTLRNTPVVRVYGTIYHQKELARLKGQTVALTIRPTREGDRFERYTYQVYANGSLVGGLDDYAFQHGDIRKYRATAFIDRANDTSPDRIRLFIPRDPRL